MQKLRAVVKKHYGKGYESDSTGYSSSSDRPISRSQFILRPSTGYSGYPSWDCTNSPSTSYSSEQSSSKLSDSIVDLFETEDTSTIRVRSPMTIIDLKTPLASPFPFDEEEDDLAGLFDKLELKEDESDRHVNTEADMSTLNRKKLLIKEPDDSSKIYFSTERQKKLRALPKKGSIPRSILKKEPSLAHMHIYEEIEDDFLEPIPGDIRPEIPERPILHPIRIFPPCKAFQPKRLDLFRYPSTKRRKKMPSLHRSGIKE